MDPNRQVVFGCILGGWCWYHRYSIFAAVTSQIKIMVPADIDAAILIITNEYIVLDAVSYIRPEEA